MKNQWKSHIRREPMDLLRPLPFYEDLVRALTREQQARATKTIGTVVEAGWAGTQIRGGGGGMKHKIKLDRPVGQQQKRLAPANR